MIKKEHQHDLDKKNIIKTLLPSKYLDQQTGSDTPKKSSFKVRFIQWLKELPLDERYLAVKVHAPGLSKQLQESLIELQNQVNEAPKKDSSVSKKITHRQAKTIVESIVLISDGEEFLDNIGFDFNYIEHPQKLYELLSITLSQQQKLMFQTQQYQIETLELKQVLSLVQKCQSKEQLSLALISFLRGEIFLKFEEKRSISLEEERSRKKQFSMYWRNLSEEGKRRLMLLNKEDFVALSSYLGERKIYLSVAELEREYTDLTQLEKNDFCNKIFKCKLKKSLTYLTDYHELVYKLWKTELGRKKKRNRNNKNNNPQKPSSSLHRTPIIHMNQKPTKRNNNPEKQLEKVQSKLQRQKTAHNLPQNKSKNEKSTHNLNSTTYNNSNNFNDKVIKSANQLTLNNQKSSKPQTSSPNSNMLSVPQSGQNQQKRKRNRNRRKKSVSAESKQTNTTTHKFSKQEKQEEDNKIQEQASIQSQHFIENISSSNVVSTLPCSINLNSERSSKQLDQKITYPEIDFKSEIFAKVKTDIQEYSDLINEEANQFYERRVIAYERIQFMLGMWKIPIKLFGSCASGITIKNSDIDIAVDNSILNYFLHLSETNRLRGALQQLEQLLQQQPWVTGLKLIKTAAIPLIKLKVNTSIKFIQMPGLQLYQAYIDCLNRQHSSAGQIHIDLTIQTINKQLQCNHLGIISTEQINSWLKSIKSLHPIVIIIKNYLTKTNLNITYEGGLNTYSMICMLVAFIKHQNLEQQSDVVHVFYQILKFYAFEFDEKTTGIDLLHPQNIFYDKLNLKSTKSDTSCGDPKKPELSLTKSTTEFCQADLEIKDPLNNGKNMTKNCYSFPKIRQIFQTIYQACFIRQQTQLESVFRQQFERRLRSGYNKEHQMLKRESKQVRELLDECRLKLGNPFLTLFE